MKIVNFSHPLTEEHRSQLRGNFGLTIDDVIAVPAKFDNAKSFASQAVALVDAVGLAPAEWETSPPLVVLPTLGIIAAAVLTEIEGRSGTFPAVIRMRPVEDALTPTFEVAEVINLLQVRMAARRRRAA